MAFRGRPVTAATLMPNSVATIHIQNLAVTDAKIDTLTVSKLTTGTLGAFIVNVQSILSLIGTGTFRTADLGNRIEITAVGNDRITFITGVELPNELAAYIQANAATGTLTLYSKMTAPPAPQQAFISLDPNQITIGGARSAVTILIPNDEMDIQAAVVRWRTFGAAIQANDGSTGYREIFPLGTFLAAADLFDSTGWALPGAAAQVMSAAAIPVEYASQPVVVLVTFEAEITGMTAGEYLYLRPTVDGNILGGGLIREEEPAAAGAIAALTHTAHSAHAAGAAPGLGHSSTGAHPHDVTGRAVNNISGPASAGTAHTHTAGTYTTVLAAGLAQSAGAHTAHGTHTIADHSAHTDHAAVAAHSHPRTYDFVIVRSGVYVGNAAAGATITLGIYGRTQATAAQVGRIAFHYLILRG